MSIFKEKPKEGIPRQIFLLTGAYHMLVCVCIEQDDIQYLYILNIYLILFWYCGFAQNLST
jgi:hypothetical protein